MTCFVTLCLGIHSNSCWVVSQQSSPLRKVLRDDSLMAIVKESIYSSVETESRSSQKDCQEGDDGNNNGND